MKRLVILSYQTLPMDVVASYRTKAYCDHLATFGIYPIIITHRWEMDERGKWKYHDDDDVVVEETARYKIIRLPRKMPQTTFRWRAGTTMAAFLRGDLEPELKASCQTFRTFLLSYLEEEKVDALLAIFNPHFPMKIAEEIRRRFGIPYLADFRDLWDNQVVTKSYQPTNKKKLIDAIIRYWWKRWIGNAEFFTTTCDIWLQFLEQLSGKKGYVVRNGFEEEYSIESVPERTPEFVVTHFGSLYAVHNHTVFVEGYKKFLQIVGRGPVLEIIGNKGKYGVDPSRILADLPSYAWRSTPYMSKRELYEHCRSQTSVFWMPGFLEDNGQVPVKVYDYLLLKKNILLAPSCGSDLESIVTGTGAGVVCDTAEEVCRQLERWYLSYRSNGGIGYEGNSDAIQRYARRHQVRIMAEAIHTHFA